MSKVKVYLSKAFTTPGGKCLPSCLNWVLSDNATLQALFQQEMHNLLGESHRIIMLTLNTVYSIFLKIEQENVWEEQINLD